MALSVETALREAEVSLPAKGRSLLIVDDEPENVAIIQALLEGPYDVHAAFSGKDALALIDSGTEVDLVISDQRMPGMTGVELLSRMAESTPDVIRILLTAYTDIEPMLDAVNRGSVFAFIAKPFEPEELRATVAEALHMKHRALLLRRLVEAYTARRSSLSATLKRLQVVQEHVLRAERMTTLGRAASGIVHNLRNLTGIMCVLVDEIRQKTCSRQLLESAQASLDSLLALVRLLECVQQFARAGDSAVSLVPTDARKLVQRTAAVALMQNEEAHCRLAIDIDPAVRLLEIDADRMSQALLALIDNAIRASGRASSVRVSVRPVSAEEPGREPSTFACFEVADTGCGMDPTILARAMDPFFSTSSPPRLGLGLETARLAAHAHGGRFELASEPGCGTKANLLIPLRGGPSS
jgi:signal transduction histidine kinase